MNGKGLDLRLRLPDWVEGLVLPNYFAPFLAQTITISLAYRSFGPPGAARPPL